MKIDGFGDLTVVVVSTTLGWCSRKLLNLRYVGRGTSNGNAEREIK